jgi:hypothetical protein
MMVRHILDLDPARMAHLLVPDPQHLDPPGQRCWRRARSSSGFNATPHLDRPTASTPGRSTEETRDDTSLGPRRGTPARGPRRPDARGCGGADQGGINVTVEDSPHRAIPIDGYRAAGAAIAAPGSWRQAPRDTIVFGLKELEEDSTPLIHRHIMFGHAYKGQPAGQVLLRRFRAGGGTLYDLEYLTDDRPPRRRLRLLGGLRGLGAFGAGLVGAARGNHRGPRGARGRRRRPARNHRRRPRHRPPRVLIIGALGRVGTGAGDLCDALGLAVTSWDMAETAHGGPFPEVLEHEIFLNCILATPGVPVFVPASAKRPPRAWRDRRHRLRSDLGFLAGEGL